MKTLLEQANELIFGDRNKHYGHPRDNFKCIADMWNAYIEQVHKVQLRNHPTLRGGNEATYISPRDVAMMMVLMKVARDANMPKEDNLIDIAGYAGCAARLDEATSEGFGRALTQREIEEGFSRSAGG